MSVRPKTLEEVLERIRQVILDYHHRGMKADVLVMTGRLDPMTQEPCLPLVRARELQQWREVI